MTRFPRVVCEEYEVLPIAELQCHVWHNLCRNIKRIFHVVTLWVAEIIGRHRLVTAFYLSGLDVESTAVKITDERELGFLQNHWW